MNQGRTQLQQWQLLRQLAADQLKVCRAASEQDGIRRLADVISQRDLLQTEIDRTPVLEEEWPQVQQIMAEVARFDEQARAALHKWKQQVESALRQAREERNKQQLGKGAGKLIDTKG